MQVFQLSPSTRNATFAPSSVASVANAAQAASDSPRMRISWIAVLMREALWAVGTRRTAKTWLRNAESSFAAISRRASASPGSPAGFITAFQIFAKNFMFFAEGSTGVRSRREIHPRLHESGGGGLDLGEGQDLLAV